ncbi:hypothetical protein Bca4012_076599 [Brassica carinata]|uniref:uncharacterized protein LOC106305570 n=1 Tax=Brassica oleracea var. oleracea TaxID=109376 RepID=UPI0006A6FCEE|nr:PREDICTED: uncharacterized protein LOC106305570 [Brassica oleracea var. oleracea]XP_022551192.1 uncharacterized protein LOC111202627 isoform X2 [Brassica napus]
MAKWSALVLIMMVVIAATVTVEAKKQNAWIKCFRKCSKPCKPNDGNCYERCKIKCGGPNPPHGPGGPPPPSKQNFI